MRILSVIGVVGLCLWATWAPAQDRYNELSFKASHNSADSGFCAPALLDLGCLGLEFDISPNASNSVFSVGHGRKFDHHRPTLREMLTEVVKWSDAHPGHEVITIHLDLKRGPGGKKTADVFASHLDATLNEVLGAARMFTPSDLSVTESWPTRAALKSKKAFVVCLSGDDTFVGNLCLVGGPGVKHWKEHYAGMTNRQAFVDLDARTLSPRALERALTGEHKRMFLNIYPRRKLFRVSVFGTNPRIKAFADVARKHGMVSRLWGANGNAWGKAEEAGVTLLSTDQVRRKPPGDVPQ